MLSKMTWLVVLAAAFVLAIGRGGAAEMSGPDPEAVAAVEAGERDEANAAWWGFDEEDSTRFLQAALDSGASRVVVPDMGKPWVVEPLSVNRDDLEVFFERGAVVEAKRGAFRGRGDCLLTVHDRRDVILRGYGATLVMQKEDYFHEPYRPSGWRMVLSIRGSNNVTVEGLTLRGAGGDGIYLGSTREQNCVKDAVIRDVVCDDNSRQGISVISAENLLIERSVFSNTSGRGPGAGIDLEPNRADERMVNVTIRNCVFENNRLGMHFFLAHLREDSMPVSVLFENNLIRDHMEGYGIGIHVAAMGDDGGRGEVVLRNNIVVNTSRAGIHFRTKSSKATRFVFEDNVLLNTALGESGSLGAPRNAPVVLHARDDRSLVPGGIEFRNLHVAALGETGVEGPVVQVGAGAADWGIVWTDVSGLIRSSLPSRQGVSFSRTGTEGFTLQVNDAQ